MAYDDPAESWKRLQVQAAQGIGDVDLEYRLNLLDMQDRWQVAEEDNVDAIYPLEIDIYIPPTTQSIGQVILRVKLKEFRSYSSTTAAKAAEVITSAAGGATTQTSANETVDYGNLSVLSNVVTDPNTAAHNHGITDGTVLVVDGGGTVTFSAYAGDSHIHDTYKHYHQVTFPDHTHGVTIPEHNHDLIAGIYVGTVASGARIVINGTDRTVALTGGATFNTNQDNLDVTQYMTATGYNTVAIHSATLGRIRCTAFVHLYVRGG